MEDNGKLVLWGYVGSSTTNNNWYYQSFFADIDYCNLYLFAIINTH